MTAIQRAQPAICDVRTIETAAGGEVHVTVLPAAGDPRSSAAEAYGRIGALLRDLDAAIVQERLFAAPDALGPALEARVAGLGDLDDGVPPTRLATRGESGRLLGVQVHAVRGIGRPRVLRDGATAAARAFAAAGRNYLTASGITAPDAPDGPAQTRRAFEAAHGLLTHAGAALPDVARTWIWMDDILAWYPQLNQVRTRFFTEHGLMGSSGGLPASTGIGVSPFGGRVALDLVAAWGPPETVARFHASGNQRSAYEYGSAFARAARVRTPGGITVFCSGTAAIDASGRSCFVGDVGGQIGMTLANVLAVLRDLGCSPSDVVQALAYCATSEVEDHFVESHRDRFPWPWLTMLGDVCRRELLFEVEVTACPEAKRL